MAEIAAVVTEISGGAHLIAWEGLAQGDTGRPIQFVGGRDRTNIRVASFCRYSRRIK